MIDPPMLTRPSGVVIDLAEARAARRGEAPWDHVVELKFTLENLNEVLDLLPDGPARRKVYAVLDLILTREERMLKWTK